MKHSFEIGKQYQNRDGKYQVISIHEPDMVIRYLDGRTIKSSIALQARIWEKLESGEDDSDLEIDI